MSNYHTPIPLNCDKPERDLIKEAGDMIGINLKEPIDLSEMMVHNVCSEPNYDDYSRMYMLRKATLFAYVTNEHGEEEELLIEFTLKSNRGPKKELAHESI